MDGILLEGRERSGTTKASAKHHSNTDIPCASQLYARRGNLPADAEGKEWTMFDMPLREPAPMPVPFDLIRFLTSSITFMTHLRRISVFLDDKRLARLEKSAGESQLLAVPRGINPRTEHGIMTISNIRSTRKS
jgi:hypothetical protein